MSEVPNTQSKVKSPATPSKPPKEKSARGSVLRWFSSKQGKSVTVAFFLVVGVIMLFVGSSIRNYHISNAYTDAKDSTAAAVYGKFYQTAFTYAEQKNHVSNRANFMRSWGVGLVTCLFRCPFFGRIAAALISLMFNS